jgi:hypothetical protein
LRPEETWCSLCHQNVVDETPSVPEPRAEPALDADPGPIPIPGAEPAEPVVAALAGADVDPELVAKADRMLAELAASVTTGSQESRLGALRSSLGPYGGMILGLAAGITLLACGLLGLTLLGLFV